MPRRAGEARAAPISPPATKMTVGRKVMPKPALRFAGSLT